MKNLSNESQFTMPEKIGQPISLASKFTDDTFTCYDLNMQPITENGHMPKIFENFHIETPYGTVHRVIGLYFIENRNSTEEEVFEILNQMALANQSKQPAGSQPGAE